MRHYGERNTEKFSNVNWSSGTGELTSLNSNSFYCAFFGSSFNTVNVKKTLKEVKRILIKKGYFCCMWNHRYLKNIHQKEIEKIIKELFLIIIMGIEELIIKTYQKKSLLM